MLSQGSTHNVQPSVLLLDLFSCSCDGGIGIKVQLNGLKVCLVDGGALIQSEVVNGLLSFLQITAPDEDDVVPGTRELLRRVVPNALVCARDEGNKLVCRHLGRQLNGLRAEDDRLR